jgi:hypothetical protein
VRDGARQILEDLERLLELLGREVARQLVHDPAGAAHVGPQLEQLVRELAPLVDRAPALTGLDERPDVVDHHGAVCVHHPDRKVIDDRWPSPMARRLSRKRFAPG